MKIKYVTKSCSILFSALLLLVMLDLFSGSKMIKPSTGMFDLRVHQAIIFLKSS